MTDITIKDFNRFDDLIFKNKFAILSFSLFIIDSRAIKVENLIIETVSIFNGGVMHLLPYHNSDVYL